MNAKKVAESCGINGVVIGDGEQSVVADIFRKAMNNDPLPSFVRFEKGPENEKESTIKIAAINEYVEISRGCGRSCQVCSLTM